MLIRLRVKSAKNVEKMISCGSYALLPTMPGDVDLSDAAGSTGTAVSHRTGPGRQYKPERLGRLTE